MKFAHLAVLAAGYGLLMACEDAPKDDIFTDTADTGVPSGPATLLPPFITGVDQDCNAAGSAFEFAVQTDNWAGIAILNIFDTSFGPAYDEEHVMDHGFFDPNDTTFDNWEVTLTDEVNINSQTPGASSVFSCANYDFLTYTIEVFTNSTDANSADCVTFGHNPSEIVSGTWPDGGEDNTTGRTDVAAGRFSNCVDINP